MLLATSSLTHSLSACCCVHELRLKESQACLGDAYLGNCTAKCSHSNDPDLRIVGVALSTLRAGCFSWRLTSSNLPFLDAFDHADRNWLASRCMCPLLKGELDFDSITTTDDRCICVSFAISS